MLLNALVTVGLSIVAYGAANALSRSGKISTPIEEAGSSVEQLSTKHTDGCCTPSATVGATITSAALPNGPGYIAKGGYKLGCAAQLEPQGCCYLFDVTVTYTNSNGQTIQLDSDSYNPNASCGQQDANFTVAYNEDALFVGAGTYRINMYYYSLQCDCDPDNSDFGAYAYGVISYTD